MARAMDPNSAGSQFFIVTTDSTFLDGQYTAFGEVTEGMEVADKIVNLQRDSNDCPLQEAKMLKVDNFTMMNLKSHLFNCDILCKFGRLFQQLMLN